MGSACKKGLEENRCYSYGRTYHQCLAQMGKSKPITLKNLERICKALDCTPNDVFSFDDEYKE
jgi:hypothetical protein